MLFSFNLYSSLLLVFFTHILIYSFLFLYRWKRQERKSDLFLGLFLALAGLYVIPWMTGFAGWYEETNSLYREILFYTPFLHGLLLGPLLYFYVKSITNFSFQFRKFDWLHFLPGILYIIWCIVVVVVDKLIVKDYYLMNGEEDPDFQGWYQWIQRLSIIIYLLLTIRYFNQYKLYASNEFSFADLAGFRWLKNFLLAFCILTGLPLIQELLRFFPSFRNLNYVGSWYYFLAFSLVVYYIAINGFNAVVIPLQKLRYDPEVLHEENGIDLRLQNHIAISESSIFKESDKELLVWKEKIENAMLQDCLFEDSELTLTQLSKHLSSNSSFISKVINEGFGKNFNDFVNHFRVEALLSKLRSGDHFEQTLMGIAYDCGFNSKATFNRAFKKYTKMSPTDWIKNNL